jgi:2-polyprenyl-3-methyl-5-hydroxy-6-metoxy-1,4-benzoquinol methylase
MLDGSDMVQVPCPLCACDQGRQLFAGGDRLLGREGLFGVTECQDCGFRFTSPRPTREGMPHYYSGSYGPYQGFSNFEAGLFVNRPSVFYRLKNDLKHTILCRHYGYCFPSTSMEVRPILGLPRFVAAGAEWLACCAFERRNPRIPVYQGHGRALDIGCGNGHYMMFLKELGWDTTGFDVTDNLAEPVRKSGIPIFTGSLDVLQDQEGSFDLITMWHVLEHLYDPAADLRLVRRLLVDGGTLMIEVPNSDSITAKLFRADWFPWDLPRHLSHFTPTSLRRMLEEAGFRVKPITHLRKTTLPNTLRYWLESRNRAGLLGPLDREDRWCHWIRLLGHPLRWCRSGETISATATQVDAAPECRSFGMPGKRAASRTG